MLRCQTRRSGAMLFRLRAGRSSTARALPVHVFDPACLKSFSSFGLLGLLLGTVCEFLASLAAFPTLLTAFAVVVPLLGWAVYLELLPRFGLGGINQPRSPVPPERFLLDSPACAAAPRDPGVPRSPGRWAHGRRPWNGPPNSRGRARPSPAGWPAPPRLIATALLVACATIYVRASHWFDRMAPWVVGACRRSLYRMSENPDFLDAQRPSLTSARKRKSRSIESCRGCSAVRPLRALQSVAGLIPGNQLQRPGSW